MKSKISKSFLILKHLETLKALLNQIRATRAVQIPRQATKKMPWKFVLLLTLLLLARARPANPTTEPTTVNWRDSCPGYATNCLFENIGTNFALYCCDANDMHVTDTSCSCSGNNGFFPCSVCLARNDFSLR